MPTWWKIFLSFKISFNLILKNKIEFHFHEFQEFKTRHDVTPAAFLYPTNRSTSLSPQSSRTHSFIQDESLTNCWQAFGWQLGCPSRVCHTFRLLDRLFSLVAAVAAAARKVVLIYGTFENSSIALDSSRLALEWDEGLNDGLGKNI